MYLNVLFDDGSRLDLRKVTIELKNVTTAEALKLVLLQEGLYSEEVGPKTILVASRLRGTSIPQIGVGTTLLMLQLAQYVGDKDILPDLKSFVAFCVDSLRTRRGSCAFVTFRHEALAELSKADLSQHRNESRMLAQIVPFAIDVQEY